MGKIYRYLLGGFFKTFLTYFGILFFFVSIVYFVRIAGYTSVLSLSFEDIFQIYFYYVPQLLMYVFPLTYFIALSISLFNFSKEGEMLVLFSLGKSPLKIVFVYFVISFLFFIFLLMNSLILMPLSEQASDNFLKVKKVESKINLKSSEVGQKIANWNIFTAKKENNNTYLDIVLFSPNYKKSMQFILAKNAKFDSFGNKITLSLTNGNHFIIKENEIIQTEFGKLNISNPIYKDKLENKKIFEYWLEAKHNHYRAKWLCIYVMLSFFVIATIFAAFSIGIVNTRVQKRSISFWIGLVVVVYYIFVFKIADISPLKGSIIFSILFVLITFLIFYKTILKRY